MTYYRCYKQAATELCRGLSALAKHLETGAGRFYKTLLFVLCYTFVPSHAENLISRDLELEELGRVPAEIQVSTNFLTIIEFEDISVELVNSARSDQITMDVSDNIVTVRANQETVNTDFFIRAGGRTALFVLTSDTEAQAPRRYVVRDEKPASRDLFRSSTLGGLKKAEDVGTPPPPPGLDLKFSVYRPSAEVLVVQYVLSNQTDYPFVNDYHRLRIYQDGVSKAHQLDVSPAAGRSGYLARGETEAGQIVVPGVPANVGALELAWELVEIGPGTVYLENVDLLAALDGRPGEDAASSALSEAPATSGSTRLEGAPTAEGEDSLSAASDSSTPRPSAEPAIRDSSDTLPEQQRLADRLALAWTFEDAAAAEAWWLYAGPGARAERVAEDSLACVDVTESGEKLWEVGFGLSEVPLEEGRTYRLRLVACADKPVTFRPAVGINEAPWTEFMGHTEQLGTELSSFNYVFNAPQSGEDHRIVFFAGQNEAPYRICFDEVEFSEVGAQ